MKAFFKRSALLLILTCLTVTSFTSCASPGAFSENTKTVMKVGNYEVSYDEYKYFYYNCMLDMGDGADFNNADTLAKLKENTETALKKRYIIQFYCDKYNRKLSKADKKEMNTAIKEYIESCGGEEKYKTQLQARRMTGDVFREQYALNGFLMGYLHELLITGYDNLIPVDDKTVINDIYENFYHYTQIFIPFEEGTDYNKNKEYAEEALKKLNEGVSFDDVAKEYSRWTVNYKTGVYTTLGIKLELIEKTALSLEVGQYSDVIFTSEGHHIIKRLPIEEGYINENFDTLLYDSATRRYNEFIDKEAAALTVEYKDYYNEFSHLMLIAR